jgi:hypothetical protein
LEALTEPPTLFAISGCDIGFAADLFLSSHQPNCGSGIELLAPTDRLRLNA